MTINNLPQKSVHKMRSLNILHDLPKVADLVELCFKKNMDNEGRSYLQQMRSASRKPGPLSWASNPMPLRGYIWGNQKEIVGNISIIPFRRAKKNIFLLANIAVHPEFRRQGIARALTQKGIEDAEKYGAISTWLHVEKDNFGAIELYKELGFQPHSERTTWLLDRKNPPLQKNISIYITSRQAEFWAEQNRWIDEAYPREIRWYRMPDFEIFRPGIMSWLYRIFVEYDIKQWVVEKDGEPQAIIMWKGAYARRTPIWLATVPQADAKSLITLLLYARHQLASSKRELYIDYHAGKFVGAFEQAGFTPKRTLLWMVKNNDK
ncbi:MAG: GNAT family N-acetyltransferase [Anaerolineae bacterium]|jgi:ribosomal protein S18 acetylase RimI-like enzyme|nr:GNAT family N-acetyltransferase [Anaerolineae bacterium]MBT7076019.1 GNAT family N-acetyltransferase [Anaerolineae bacterium]MBT7783887.1 GNAT family N-acetyltransferase [Anaerolineae bacterium]